MIYDLIIIGGGPAGAAAGVYAARKRLCSLLITNAFGGQSSVSDKIENWIGTVAISGEQLAENLRTHVEAYAGDCLKIRKDEWVTGIKKEHISALPDQAELVTVTTDKGTYQARAVLVATGSHQRKITVPGAEKYEHKGITYCASCDGPMFSDMDVVVLGAGNAAFETASQLLAYAKSVTLIHRGDTFRAEPITIEKVCQNPHMRVIKNAEILEVKGSAMVSSIVYKDKISGEVVDLPTQGIFVEIGQLPNTSFVKGVVELTPYDQIVIDARTQKTSVSGIWAAGDCTDILYHQNNIAAGDAVRALEDIYVTLRTK